MVISVFSVCVGLVPPQCTFQCGKYLIPIYARAINLQGCLATSALARAVVQITSSPLAFLLAGVGMISLLVPSRYAGATQAPPPRVAWKPEIGLAGF